MANWPALTSVTVFPFPMFTINVPTLGGSVWLVGTGYTYHVSWDDAGQVELEELAGQCRTLTRASMLGLLAMGKSAVCGEAASARLSIRNHPMLIGLTLSVVVNVYEIGRASCRERV